MISNRIDVLQAQDENRNSSQPSTPTARTIRAHLRQSRLMRIMIASLVIIVLIAGIVVSAVVRAKKNGKTLTMEVMPTTTSIETVARTTAETTTTTTAGTTTRAPSPIVFGSRLTKVYGIHETKAGKKSHPSQPVISSNFGHYSAIHPPVYGCDGDIETKHFSYGNCYLGGSHCVCGLDSGFYLELQQGAVLVIGLQICTADDRPGQDPIEVTLEGSNAPVSDLTEGASWSLLYTGHGGLEEVLDRNVCGPVQWFNNSIAYKSYRFLVFGKRERDGCLHYADVKLFGP